MIIVNIKKLEEFMEVLMPFESENFAKSIMNLGEIIVTPSKKSVKFYEKVKVHLIPSRHEYIIRGMVKDLWYSDEDLRRVQGEAQAELFMLAFNEKISLNDAKKLLYQFHEDNNKSKVTENEKAKCTSSIYSHNFFPIFPLISERPYSEVCR